MHEVVLLIDSDPTQTILVKVFQFGLFCCKDERVTAPYGLKSGNYNQISLWLRCGSTKFWRQRSSQTTFVHRAAPKKKEINTFYIFLKSINLSGNNGIMHSRGTIGSQEQKCTL